MPRPVACPHCGEELDIPAEFRGRQVRCAACAHTFVTPPPDAPEPPRATRVQPSAPAGRDKPGRSPEFDDDHAPWDDRPRRRRRKGGSLLWLWVVLGLGTLGLVGLCGGCVVLAVVIDNPDLTPFESKQGRFVASFPKPPTESQKADGGRTVHHTEANRSFPKETYFVRYADLPKVPADEVAREVVFRDACARALAQVPGGTEQSRVTGTADGYPTVTLTVEHPDGETLTAVRFVLAGRRLYAVGITGQMLLPESERVRAFQASFRVTAPDEKK